MRDFQHSVNVLVKAYLNDTLEHLNCYACAVGNLVADSCGFTFIRSNQSGETDYKGFIWKEQRYPAWSDVIMCGDLFLDCYKGEARKQITSTQYSLEELRDIETAFEFAPEGNSRDEYMFNGLMAVVDKLAEIHGISLEEKKSAKSLFVKA